MLEQRDSRNGNADLSVQICDLSKQYGGVGGFEEFNSLLLLFRKLFCNYTKPLPERTLLLDSTKPS